MSRKLLISKLYRSLWFILVALAVAGFTWGWHRFLYLQSDTFWLVQTGCYILEHLRLPQYDIYSFTRAGQPWIVYQWLFELLLALLYAVADWRAISIFATVFLAGFLLCVMFAGMLRDKTNPLAALCWIVFAVAATMPDIVSVRPQLLTFPLLWVCQRLLERAAAGRTKAAVRLWWLAPVMLLWVNIHLSFVLQLGLIAVYAIFAGIKRQQDLFLRLSGIGALCLVVSLINPHGTGIYQFLLHSWQDHNITPELRPLQLARNPVLLTYIVLCAGALVSTAGRFSAASLVVSLLLLVSGLAGARFILYFVLWTLPLAAAATTRMPLRPPEWWAWLCSRFNSLAGSPLYPAAVALGAAFSAGLQPTLFPSTVPLEAAEYIHQHPPRGNLFNGENAGSYLIFRFAGKLPVFIDTRADVYGRDYCRTFAAVLVEGQRWQELMDEYDIQCALVPAKYKLAEVMRASPEWSVCYQDKTYLVLQRNHGGQD